MRIFVYRIFPNLFCFESNLLRIESRLFRKTSIDDDMQNKSEGLDNEEYFFLFLYSFSITLHLFLSLPLSLSLSLSLALY